MKKIYYLLFMAVSILSACQESGVTPDNITIYTDKKGVDVSPSMYGIFFEEINHAGDGGLYAELVNNRSFEELEMPKGYTAQGDAIYPIKERKHLAFRWTTEPVPAWSLKGKDEAAASMKLTKENPKFASAPNNLKVTIKDASQPVRLVNRGYWGMGIKEGEQYHLRTIIRPGTDYSGEVTARIISENGDVLASAKMESLTANQWNDIKMTLTSSATDPKATLALEFDAKGSLWIDYVSLFPEKTFNNRPNGSRADVANMLAGLKPAFIRWPGGCVVEGISLANRFEWKKTLGDPASRPGEYSTWGYRCSYGFGYYELLQLCEDFGADAMFVCNVGLGCQFRVGDVCSNQEISYYVNDCLDAIEYAIGDTDTKWGSLRASHGHPAPFPLKYIEIGNENWGDEYDKRFDIFYEAIKSQYPQLTLISNHGLGGTTGLGGGADRIKKTDMIDPHWYVRPDFFFDNTTIFDNHPRGKYTAYVGEYACNNGVGSGNMLAALSEAAFITGMERNGDLVTMTSYAPLLENRNDRSWPVNMIWLDTDQVVGRSSYYVQQMAADYRPTYTVESSMYKVDAKPVSFEKGAVGVGSWASKVEYKDIQITQGDHTIRLNPEQYTSQQGSWSLENDILKQTGLDTPTQRILSGFSGNEYTLELKARKTDGYEGFLIYFGMTEDGKNGFFANIGGWGNYSTALQDFHNGSTGRILGKSVNHTIDKDRWYDIKIVANKEKIDLFVDGKSLISYTHMSQPLQFISSGIDEEKGELILKVVNAGSKPYAAKFNLEGTASFEKNGKVITLSAKDGEDENSFEDPQKIAPKETEFKDFGKSFKYEFSPYSFTVLCIKLK